MVALLLTTAMLSLAVAPPAAMAQTSSTIPDRVPENNEAARGAYLERGIIPLSNLFDDPKGTSLVEAITSDMFSADAEPTDLGVWLLVTGDNKGVKSIAPGISFDFTNLGGAVSKAGKLPGNDASEAGSAIPEAAKLMPVRITGLGPHNGGPPLAQKRYCEGFGLHADGRITFDLDEIRKAGKLHGGSMTFTAIGAVNDSGVGHKDARACQFHLAAILSDENGVLVGQVNGKKVMTGKRNGVWSFTGAIPRHFDGHDGNGDNAPDGMIRADFSLDIPAKAKWLTLVSTTEAGSNLCDHAVWVDARLTIVREPSASKNLPGTGSSFAAYTWGSVEGVR